MKQLQTTHKLLSGKIRIRQYWNTEFEYGSPEGTYYTATIDGWNGFKFETNTLKLQPLFEKVYEYCESVYNDIKNNGSDALNKYPKVITIN